MNPFLGADANALSNEQLKKVFGVLNQSNLNAISKELVDARFNNIMNRVEYDVYLASKYVEEPSSYYDAVTEGEESTPGPVEDIRPYGDEPVFFAQVMPEYPGGQTVLNNDLAKNIRYPENMKELGIQGKVYLSFTVEKDGSITDIQVARGISGGKELNEEAVRVLKNLPKKFSPGKMNNKPVRVRLTIPVNFQLR